MCSYYIYIYIFIFKYIYARMLQTKTHFSRYIIYVYNIYIYIKYTLYISSRCLKFPRPISPSTWWWTWWPLAAPCPSWPLAAWPSPVHPWPNCWGWRYRTQRRKNGEFSGKNGDFAGKIWSFSWNLTCWDSTFETRDFAMKHGEDLRICPGMEHNWVFKLMAFNHSSFGHFQGKLTTSQCHYVCRFPALILAALTTHQYMC